MQKEEGRMVVKYFFAHLCFQFLIFKCRRQKAEVQIVEGGKVIKCFFAHYVKVPISNFQGQKEEAKVWRSKGRS